MSSTYNHPQPVDLGGNVQTDASATTIKPVEGAPQDATHAPMTVIVDPDAKPEKMSFKEQVSSGLSFKLCHSTKSDGCCSRLW